MSKRLEILQQSLLKKEKKFDDRLQEHFDTVKQSNGQPLNDKRNGAATTIRWDRQNDALRTMNKEIEKTKNAIEREEGKINGCEYIKTLLPEPICKLIDSGELIQWRKHPNIFFVPGVDKARIGWDLKKKFLYHNYVGSITDRDAHKKFADIFNSLKASIQTNDH